MYMRKEIIIFLLIITMLIIPLGNVMAKDKGFEYFPHENLLDNEIREKELIDPKKFIKFISLDEQYLLNTKLSKKQINREIAYLDKQIFLSEENFVLTKKGVILYTPNMVGNINVYQLALRNRKKLLEKKSDEKFVYDKDVFYYPQKAVRGKYSRNINPERLLETYVQTKAVLDNIDIEKRYIENLVVSVTPFKMVGLNGFTEPFGNYNEGTTIVIGKEVSSLPAKSQAYKEEIKSTLLHELGHVFHYVANRNYNIGNDKINLETPFWREYSAIYNNDIDKTYDAKTKKGWETDISENFAEDFRLYFSSRLGDHSFKAKDKRTKYPYNKKVDSFIEGYMKKGGINQKPSIYKSFIEVNGEEIPIGDNQILEFSKNDSLEIKIEAGRIKRESYVQVWSDNMNVLSKVDMKAKDIYEYKIPPKSNISTVVKYEKMGLNFKPIWRINIVE